MLLQVFYRGDIGQPRVKRAHAVVHAVRSERLFISGQIGIRADGGLEPGMRAQMERAWQNLFDTVQAAGFERRHIARITAYVTEPGRIVLFREISERMLQGHACPCAYRQVSGLESPTVLCELEAEAVRDEDEAEEPAKAED